MCSSDLSFAHGIFPHNPSNQTRPGRRTLLSDPGHMAAAAVTSNGGAAAAANGPSPGRLASVYSKVQTSRLLHALPLPSVLRSDFSVVDGPASSAAGNPGKFDSPRPLQRGASSDARLDLSGPASGPVCDGFELIRFVGFFNRSGADEIAKLFPNLFGQPSASLVPSADPAATRPLKVGVVLSGGQAPGGHNVICGIFGEYQLPSIHEH